MKRALLASILAILPLCVATPADTRPPASCLVTETVRATPPKDRNADPFGSGPWYVNADRTIWAQATWMTTRERGNKVLWIRPAGTDLSISARRIDGSTGKFKAATPCCYPTGFQATGLHFSESGCWEITAQAGSAKLTFITWVHPEESGQ
jgi:hypothetical protein